MSVHSEDTSWAIPVILIKEHAFGLMGSLIPERDALETIREFRPQERYAGFATVALHKHGHGTFCRFRISVPKGLSGVYALVVDGSVRYIGECKDLGKRFNVGYGQIAPRNCYVGGQQTNCKINRRVLEVARAGGRIDLYFRPTLRRHILEKELLTEHLPPWND